MIFPGCFQDAPKGLVGLVDSNDPKDLDDPQLFDDPSYSMIPQLFDDQLEVWTLIIQKSTVIPPSLIVLCLFSWVIGKPPCFRKHETHFSIPVVHQSCSSLRSAVHCITISPRQSVRCQQKFGDIFPQVSAPANLIPFPATLRGLICF